MKKILIALFVILVVNSFCSVRLSSVSADEAKTFIGTIESLRPAMGRPPKWYAVRFTAVAANGEKKDFWILGLSGSSPTSVIDFDGKPMDKPGYNHRPRVGKKVEIKYSIASNGYNEAISIRYVPSDYAPQPAITTGRPNVAAQTVVTANAYGEKIFVGKIESSPPNFRIPPMRKIILVSDNGDRITVFVSREIAIRDMKAYPTRIGKRVEVKYSVAQNGENETTSVRYLD
ncbi:MAG: hypothetical protein PHP46_02020 [Candidatus Omnitrophica bacterium]|nr:hypothetical protein [Candidatus Omnitrophota bacterium]